MNLTVISINAIALACLAFSLFKDRTKTVKALRTALKSGIGLAPTLLTILVLIGLVLGFVPLETIGRILGEGSGAAGVLTAALLGSVLHIPSLVSFPLGGSLMKAGASATVVAVFITTLTMVGFVTIPMEIRVLGKRFTFLRNGLSLVAAVIIGLLVGVLA
ncbi:MAG: permease [Actinomycetota bacterium]